MARGSGRSFLVGFAATCIVIAALMVVTNLIVDPFWIFNLVTIPGVNGQRAEVPNQARLSKAEMVCRLQPTAVAMGSSRVEVGIDPKYAAWPDGGNGTYNLALAGTGLEELYLTLQHAVHASPSLHLVVVGLDFFMFNANREAVVFGGEVLDFDRRRLLLSPSDNCLRSFLYDSSELIGPQGLAYDMATIRAQLPESDRFTMNHGGYWSGLYQRDGFRGRYIEQAMQNVASKYGFRNVMDGLSGKDAAQEAYYVSKVWLPPPDQRYCFSKNGRTDTMTVFRQMVEFARQSKIDIRFMINPIHARMLIALQEAGLWPQYEDWKRDLVSILAQDAAAHHAPAFPLWDFSGFNSVTTERIPANGDVETPMRWWWEPSHFQQAAGNLMLDRVLNYQKDLPSVPKDFGILLQPSNIESWIEQNRKAGPDYRRVERAEVKIVTDRVAPILANITGTNCGTDIDLLREASADIRRGDRAAAEPLFAHAIAIDEEGRRRAAELGMPYRETGFAKALAEARAGKEIPVNLADWIAYQTRGNQRAASGDLKGAADDFGHAIRIGPPNAALYFLRGTTRLQLNDRSGAAEDFEAGLKLDPTNKTLQQLLQQARAAELSVSGATKPNDIDPAAAKALQAQADAARSQGDLANAIRLYGASIAVSPPNTALYYLRGTARLQSGDRLGAEADFQEGLKLDPNNVTLRELLAQAQSPAPQTR